MCEKCYKILLKLLLKVEVQEINSMLNFGTIVQFKASEFQSCSFLELFIV